MASYKLNRFQENSDGYSRFWSAITHPLKLVGGDHLGGLTNQTAEKHFVMSSDQEDQSEKTQEEHIGIGYVFKWS